jgi:nucleolar protein 9
MPKENKQRGRRGKGKRKNEDNPNEEPLAKRPALDIGGMKFVGAEGDVEAAFKPLPFTNAPGEDGEAAGRPFYGLLSEEEQEYFRRADELLELNDFPSDEDRALFLANVFKEAEGKELKIANSQSCSRLMERLILLSTPAQKKKLFEKFSGQFLHLIQHRFASHCCETLFVQSAPVVTQELTADGSGKDVEATKDGDDVYVSMENLFLYTLNELEGQIGFLLNDRFASHALRVLLVVLSGKPLAKSSTKSLLQSRKKENITTPGFKSSTEELSLDARAVPSSFQTAINKFISDTAAILDETSIPLLSCHQTANPALQVLLELELTRPTKAKDLTPETSGSILKKLLPDAIETEGSKSATFINGLVYEQIGSRLLETLVTYAPGKLFKQIYRSTFKDRIGSLARNEIASYVIVKVLERVSREDLEEAAASILPQVPNLVERGRTTILKTLLERTAARHAEKSTAALTAAIAEAYGNDPATLILKMTHTTAQGDKTETDEALAKAEQARQDPNTLHGSLLAQAMLAIPGTPSTLIQDSLLAQNLPTLLHLACTTATSHILQAALVPTDPSSPSNPGSTNNAPFRRKLVNAFLADPSSITTLATSKSGSHVLDALWDGTQGLMMLKERICSILADSMPQLRDDWVGRVVLRNWMVELFARRKVDWIAKVREGEGGKAPVIVGAHNDEADKAKIEHKGPQGKGYAGKGAGKGGKDASGKTAIQLAREKFAAGKAKGEMKVVRGKGTGANAGAVKTR